MNLNELPAKLPVIPHMSDSHMIISQPQGRIRDVSLLIILLEVLIYDGIKNTDLLVNKKESPVT